MQPAPVAAAAPAPAGPGVTDRQFAPAHTLVLVRHGESVWNLANRFTGWTDVDLTPQGRRQAAISGSLLRAHGLRFDLAFTSVLKRAIRTLHILEDSMDALYIPEVKSWRLNERHYGALQGLNKAETAAIHGEEQVHIWRRSYAIQPPALEASDPRHPRFDVRYRDLPAEDLPAAESLKDCIARSLPFWNSDIAPAVQLGRRVVVAAHGNSLRGIIKHLDSISDEGIMQVELPVGSPLVYELDEHLVPIRHYYLGHYLGAAPPLDVTVLPTLVGEAGAAPESAVAGAAKAEQEGEKELKALMEALVASSATTADHVHNAATAAALAGDLATAEELMLRGALAAAKYVFGYLPGQAVAEAAAAAPAVLAPAEPLVGDAPADVPAAHGGDAGELTTGCSQGAGGQGASALGGSVAAFKRAAPLLDVERHVLVAMAAAGASEVAAAAPGPPVVASSLAATLLAEVGVDKKVVLALARSGGEAVQAGAPGSDARTLSVAWRRGGWVWGVGKASREDTCIIAEALTCATGSIWEAQEAHA